MQRWKKGDQQALDLAHLDQVGFALTLPTSRSWSVVGEPIRVDYEAPQGRRVNGIGAYFTHGPEAGAFHHETYVRFPLPKGVAPEMVHQIARAARAAGGAGEAAALPDLSKGVAASLAKRAEQHGVEVADFGIINGEVLVRFLWKISGRPEGVPGGWRRARPLYVVLDNYKVHKSKPVARALPALNAAGIHLVYLPAYSPKLSRIEPLWHTTKYHDMPKRSFTDLGELKEAVDTTLARRTVALRDAARQRRVQ